MPAITVNGEVFRKVFSGRTIVLVSPPDDERLLDWMQQHDVVTKLLELRHPQTNNIAPVLMPSERLVSEVNEGGGVKVTLETRRRTDKNGNGLRTVQVVPV